MLSLKVLATGSSGNCYLLTCDTNGKTLILDAGIPIKEIRRGLDYNMNSVSAVFVSHTAHRDHGLAVDDLRKSGIPIFDPCNSAMLHRVFSLDGFVLKSFHLPHDGVENRGVYITAPNGHRMLYMTDYEYCPYRFFNQALNTLLIECNYCKSMLDPDEEKYNHVLRGHAELDTVKGIVEANKTTQLRNVILCHLSYTSADEDEILDTIRGVVDVDVNVMIAKAGMEISLDSVF